MGKRQITTEDRLQKKLRVLKMLKENNVSNEKELQKLSTAAMLSIPGITVHDLQVIIDFQQTVRENRLLSYLLESEGMKALAGVEGGDDDEE